MSALVDDMVAAFLAQPDPVQALAKWYLDEAPSIGAAPFHCAVSRIGCVSGAVLLRHYPFQIQLFICPPDIIIPEHTHPDVDSYEVYIGGQIDFMINGSSVSPLEKRIADEEGWAALRGSVIRVKPTTKHGGKIGKEGGIFVSVQQWLNDVEITCITQNHSIGEVMHPERAH